MLDGLAIRSVTFPAFARIVDTLNLSFNLSAESLYVARGAAGATAVAAPPTPTATTTRPAASLFLRMFMPPLLPDAKAYVQPPGGVQSTLRAQVKRSRRQP